MAEQWGKFKTAGIGHVGSYQASGHPWVSGSHLEAKHEHTITFPFVTKSITVMQTGSTGKVRIHFVATGTMEGPKAADQGDGVGKANNFWEFNSKEDAMTMNIKCKELFISNGDVNNNTGYRIFAELTRISTAHMWDLTGSGISD